MNTFIIVFASVILLVACCLWFVLRQIRKDIKILIDYKYTLEELEKNRLIACDNMTEEEVEREQRFVIDFLKKNSRTPTFSDCIEITRREMIEKVVKFLKSTDFCKYYNQEFIDEFIRKMEE